MDADGAAEVQPTPAVSAILYATRWPWHAAAHYGAKVRAPAQYLRSRPRQHSDLFDSGE